jgi:signal transduction histidine kinase
VTDRSAAVPAAGNNETGLVAAERRSPEAVWAEAFQALANHVAHDLRNALNGVAVNLEVVRTRSSRGAAAAAIAPFAATAASQFEAVTAGAEALLAFARPEPAPPDVAAIIARLSHLTALKSESRVQVNDSSEGQARTSAPAAVVRAVVARSVLNALAEDDTISCEIGVDDGIFVHVTGALDASPPDPELVAIALAHGVHIVTQARTLELRFPAVGPRAIPHTPS